jgi:hypothetical protein
MALSKVASICVQAAGIDIFCSREVGVAGFPGAELPLAFTVKLPQVR